MKRLLLFVVLLTTLPIATKAQGEEDIWPKKPKLIPGLDVEIFDIDGSHTKLQFSIGFFGFSDVEGSFDRFGGTVLYNEEDLEKTSVSLLIDATSINTGSSRRDKDLQKENFFDTENHRMIKFESKRVVKRGKNFEVVGDLTIKGKIREVSIPFQRTRGRFIDPFWNHVNIGFKGTLTLNRMDFDVHGGRWGETVLSDEVKVEFSLVAKKSNDFRTGQGEHSQLISQVVDEVLRRGTAAGKLKYGELAKTQELDAFYTTLIGRRLIQKDKFQEAIEMFDFTLEKFPDQIARISRYKAKCYAYLGNKAKALELYELIGSRNPFDTEAWEMLKHLK